MTAARLAGPSDLAAVVALTESAYAEYLPVLGAPPIPVTEDYVPRIAQGEVWLVHDGTGEAAAPVAALVIETHPDHLTIFSLAVVPGAQGRGLGQWMLRHAEALAVQAGVKALRLYTNTRMERNIAIYRRFGFVDTGQRPNPARPGWMLLDMEKRL